MKRALRVTGMSKRVIWAGHDKGDHDGFSEISFIILRGDERGYEVFIENKATSDDGDGSALVSGSYSGSSKVLRTRVKGDETFDGAI